MIVESEPLYDKVVVCPFCSNSFKTSKVRSKFKFASRVDYDLGSGTGEKSWNPLYYFVSVCTKCNFIFSEEFSEHFSQIAREKIQDKISNLDLTSTGPRDFEQVIRLYKLAIYFGELKNEKHAVIGGLCQRLASIYRDNGDDEQEERFLGLALKEFEESYLHSDYLGSYSEVKFLYLIGELSRRLGKFAQAVKYYSMVVGHPERAKEPFILRSAREHWAETMAEKRKL